MFTVQPTVNTLGGSWFLQRLAVSVDSDACVPFYNVEWKGSPHDKDSIYSLVQSGKRQFWIIFHNLKIFRKVLIIFHGSVYFTLKLNFFFIRQQRSGIRRICLFFINIQPRHKTVAQLCVVCLTAAFALKSSIIRWPTSDPLTEVYGLGFYLQYMARWPEYFMVGGGPVCTLYKPCSGFSSSID